MIDQMLPFIVTEAAAWVRTQRDHFRPFGAPLDAADLAVLAKYFPGEILNSARVAVVESIPSPAFYAVLRAQGFTQLPDFADMLGVTFDDTIVIAEQKLHKLNHSERRVLLFHELVHVVQYQRIGVDRFLHHCVTSWAQSGFRYERIILEMHAHGLDREFGYSSAPFSVAQRLAILMRGLN